MIQGSLIKEQPAQPVTKLRCYYCSKFTYDIDKFVDHLDWHYNMSIDKRLPWERIASDKKVNDLYWVRSEDGHGKWEDRS